jgi:hypothetical protein
VDGKIARKPPLVQATLWREQFPRSSPTAKRKAINEGFQQDVGTGGNWTRLSETEVRCVPGKQASFAYFAGGARADSRLAFTAVPEPGAWTVARITSRGVPVTLSVPPSSGGAGESGALVLGTESHDSDPPPGAFGRQAAVGEPTRIQLCVADGEAWALVDGVEVARKEVPLDRRGDNRVEIGAEGGAVRFRDVVVARDVVYDAGGGPSAYDVPKDGFFFIGDNVEQSEDSRRWFVEVFHPPGGAAPLAAKSRLPSRWTRTRGGSSTSTASRARSPSRARPSITPCLVRSRRAVTSSAGRSSSSGRSPRSATGGRGSCREGRDRDPVPVGAARGHGPLRRPDDLGGPGASGAVGSRP